MERNLNRGIAISKGFSRTLYCDLGEMTGVCVEGHAHRAQNTSDLDEIARRMRNEHIEIGISIFLFVEVGWRREDCAAGLCFWCLWASRAALDAPRRAAAAAFAEYWLRMGVDVSI